MFTKFSLFSVQGILIFGLLIACSLMLQSCFGSSSNRRGKLSDAMEEASDEHKGDRVVETEPDPEYEYEDPEYDIVTVAQPASLVSTDSAMVDSTMPLQGPRLTWFTIAGGTGLLKKGDFIGFNHFNLALGTYAREKHYLELTAGFSWAPVQETSLLNESLDGGVTLLQLSLGYKYYITPRYTFMGLYVCAGLGYTYMRWSYKNPFEAMEYDEYGDELGMETISSDGLSGFEAYTGLGINLVQTEGFQLGVEALPGLIIWGGSTSEGFDNDVFDDFYYTKLKIFLRFGW